MRIIKALFCFVLCLGISVLSVADTAYIESQKKEVKADTTIKWRECGFRAGSRLKIATFTTNPPFGWTEKEVNGENVTYVSRGFGVEFVKSLLDELHIYSRFVGFQSDREALAALSSGEADIFVGAYYDPKQRMAGHTYIIPSLFQNSISVIFLEGKEKPIKNLKDLIGLKGVVRQDEIFYNYVHAIMPKDIMVEQVIDSRDAFTKLLTGEADYMLSSPYSAESESRRFKINHKIKMVPLPIAGQELFIVYSGRSECPQYRRELMALLKKKKPTQQEAVRMLFSYMDTWGERFRDAPSLPEQLKQQQRESSSTPEEAVTESPEPTTDITP